MPVVQNNTPKERIRALHDVDGLSWREIGALSDYKGVPHGVIYDFVVLDIEPRNKTYRRILGLPEIIEQKVYRTAGGQFKEHPKEQSSEDQTKDRHTH